MHSQTLRHYFIHSLIHSTSHPVNHSLNFLMFHIHPHHSPTSTSTHTLDQFFTVPLTHSALMDSVLSHVIIKKTCQPIIKTPNQTTGTIHNQPTYSIQATFFSYLTNTLIPTTPTPHPPPPPQPTNTTTNTTTHTHTHIHTHANLHCTLLNFSLLPQGQFIPTNPWLLQTAICSLSHPHSHPLCTPSGNPSPTLPPIYHSFHSTHRKYVFNHPSILSYHSLIQSLNQSFTNPRRFLSGHGLTYITGNMNALGWVE